MGADRKRGPRPVAVAVGAPERRTFEMPELCLPIRTTGLRSLPALMLLVARAVLGGCSGGDFGRTRADMRNDDMHRWLAPRPRQASASSRRNSSSPKTNASFAISPIP